MGHPVLFGTAVNGWITRGYASVNFSISNAANMWRLEKNLSEGTLRSDVR